MTSPTFRLAQRFPTVKLEDYFRQTEPELSMNYRYFALALGDLQLVSNIRSAYSRLGEEFTALTAVDEQARFIMHYRTFILLGRGIENEQEALNREFSRKTRGFNLNLAYELRKLLLEVYGEEYLDDITYRNALISSVRPVLALRKLLSPIKLGAMVLIGLSRLTRRLAIRLVMYWIEIMDTTVKDYEEHKITSFLYFLFKIIFLLFAPFIILICTISYFFLGSASLVCLWAITPALTILASPVNQLVRPLADKTHIPAFIITPTCLLAFGTLIFFAMQEALWTASVAFIFHYINILVVFYLYYKLAERCFDISKDSIIGSLVIGIFLGALIFLLGYTGFFLTQAIWVSQVAEFVCLNIINVFLYVIMHQSGENIEFFHHPPQVVLSDTTRNSILLANKTASQSHRFFNTPHDAEVVPAEQRTCLHRASIFFGGHGNVQQTNLLSQIPGWENRPSRQATNFASNG